MLQATKTNVANVGCEALGNISDVFSRFLAGFALTVASNTHVQ